jgi:DNA-binding transcriptional ArsR family regulator
MKNIDLAEVGALVGDPARAAMLDALMDGRALTAGELAFVARVSAPTASEHLKRLTNTRVIAAVSQGRHRYFRIASTRVAQMMESIGVVAAIDAPQRRRPQSRIDAALRDGRMCYDHLAGRLGVGIADAMIARRFVALDADGGEVTPAGFAFFNRLGIDLETPKRGRRAFCRPCLDWSERRFHIAGHTGRLIASHFESSGWIKRERDSRVVTSTGVGRDALHDLLGIDAATFRSAA